MDIIDIYKTNPEDITIPNYDTTREVYTILYNDSEKIGKTIQCYGDSPKFLAYLDSYGEKLKGVELSLKGDVKPFFSKVKKIRNLIAIPSCFLLVFFFFWISSFSPEIIGVLSSLGVWATCLPILVLANQNIPYTMDNVRRYIPDMQVVNAIEELNKKKKKYKELRSHFNEYSASLETKFREEQERKAKSEQERESQRQKNEEKQEDYLDYLQLSLEKRLKLYERASYLKKIRKENRIPFTPDMPSFLMEESRRNKEREENFLEFSLKDPEIKKLNIKEDSSNIFEQESDLRKPILVNEDNYFVTKRNGEETRLRR